MQHAGVLGACVPLPSTDTTGDSNCDSMDDDCDGLVDQNCPTVIAACIHVSPDRERRHRHHGGITAPFQTIPTAIASHWPRPTSKPICVAGGPTCQDHATYTAGRRLDHAATLFQMSPGVSVYGNYESTGWTRCARSPDGAHSRQSPSQLHENSGVQFPSTINTPTALDGFVLTRNNGGSAPHSISAVTVNGAKQVRLSNLVVNDTPNAGNTYGVDLMNGGEALITHCLIFGGARNDGEHRRALVHVEADDPRELLGDRRDHRPLHRRLQRLRRRWRLPAAARATNGCQCRACCSTRRRARRSRPARSAARRA